MDALSFAPPPVSEDAEKVRAEVREFLKVELANRPPFKKAEFVERFGSGV